MKLMLYKEFREGWRSFRIPGLLLLAAFFALMDPPMLKYMDKILARFAQGMVLELPPVTPEAAFTQFVGDITGIFAIAAVLTTMGLAAKELNSGVAAWLLSRPVSRDSYLIAKLVFVLSANAGIIMATGTVCSLYIYTLIGALDVVGVALALIALVTYVLLPVTATLIVSALSGRAWMAAFTGLAVLLGGDLLGWLAGLAEVYWTPFSIKRQVSAAVAGVADHTYWLSLLLAWLLIVLLTWSGTCAFRKRAT